MLFKNMFFGHLIIGFIIMFILYLLLILHKMWFQTEFYNLTDIFSLKKSLLSPTQFNFRVKLKD